MTYPDGFVDWMTGYCDAFEDMPDGAWQECCKEGVVAFNKENGTHIDPYEGWLYWLAAESPPKFK